MTQNTYIDPSDVPSRIQALQAASDKALAANPSSGYAALANAAGQTLTAQQIIGKTLLRSGAAAVSDATPTAAAIVAALGGAANVAVGDTFELTIRNKNTGTLTITAGNNVTLEGVTTVAQDYTRRYLGRVTAVGTPAVTLHGISTAAV